MERNIATFGLREEDKCPIHSTMNNAKCIKVMPSTRQIRLAYESQINSRNHGWPGSSLVHPDKIVSRLLHQFLRCSSLKEENRGISNFCR
jgi:hypothetical protein